MTYAEYKSKIDGLLTNPDTALGEVGAVYEELEKDLTTLESLTAEIGTLKNQVAELRETNVKLYMQGMGEATAEPETVTEEDGEAYIDDVFEKLLEDEED